MWFLSFGNWTMWATSKVVEICSQEKVIKLLYKCSIVMAKHLIFSLMVAIEMDQSGIQGIKLFVLILQKLGILT